MKKLIKLTPLDTYFFGSENTFGADNKENYMVKSMYYPQQTAVLGFLRHQLLLQSPSDVFNNDRIVDAEKAKNLIGGQSFKVTDTYFNFGVIKEISTLCVYDQTNKEVLIKAPLSAANVSKKKNEIQLDFLKPFRHNDKLMLNEFDPKEGFADAHYGLVNHDLIQTDNVFNEVTQVGINKSTDGATNDNAFFIQTAIKFKEVARYCFAFTVTFKNDVSFSNSNCVAFGGENAKFKMQVEDFDEEFFSLNTSSLSKKLVADNSKALVLLSDAFVENSDAVPLGLNVTEIGDFRSLFSIVGKTNHYNSFSKMENSKSITKSGLFNLYKRGSIFYENIEEIRKELEYYDHFRKIGYNQFSIISNS